MQFWTGLILGLILGWVIEWIIDWWYWRGGSGGSALSTSYGSDLTRITGINSNYDGQLKSSGISSIAALAGSTPSAVRSAVGGSEGKSIDAEAWIAEASGLSDGGAGRAASGSANVAASLTSGSAGSGSGTGAKAGSGAGTGAKAGSGSASSPSTKTSSKPASTGGSTGSGSGSGVGAKSGSASGSAGSKPASTSGSAGSGSGSGAKAGSGSGTSSSPSASTATSSKPASATSGSAGSGSGTGAKTGTKTGTGSGRGSGSSSSPSASASRGTSSAAGAKTGSGAGGTGDRKDNLTKIHGVGKVFQGKFYDAGYTTWESVSKLNDAEIRRVIQPKDWQKIETDVWIEEARILAGGGATGRASSGGSGGGSGRGDDLTKIHGVGKVYQGKFHDAGVYLWSEVAALSDEKILAIIEPAEWQKIEPEEWKAEARKFAKEKGGDA